jgi:hypothetical protein
MYPAARNSKAVPGTPCTMHALTPLAACAQGDNTGDQLVVVTGPPNHPFISDEDLAEVEFFAEVLGDEACNLVATSGARLYRAEHAS